MSSPLPVVLIVGASFGGLSVATKLIENDGLSKCRVILVDSKDYFSMGGLWQFVWNDRLALDAVQWPLQKANLPGIDLRTNTTVTRWSAQEKTVVFQDGTDLSYDHIVVACGVLPDPTSIPGLQKHVNVCTMDMIPRQRMELQELISKAQQEEEKVTFVYAISMNPYKCPPAPFELTCMVDEALRKAQVRENARVVITCPVDWPMPPVLKAPFHEKMKEKGIEFLEDHVMSKVDDDGTIHYSNGSTIRASLIWSSWPIRAPDFVRDAIPLNPKGFVTVSDKVTNTIPGIPNAHVIGDCCTVPFGGRFALPKTGEFAWKMGQSVAEALLSSLNSSSTTIGPANRSGHCYAEVGFGKAIVLHPNFSDVCNDPESGKPKMTFDRMEEGGDQIKIEWAKGYVTKLFGDDAAKLLSL